MPDGSELFADSERPSSVATNFYPFHPLMIFAEVKYLRYFAVVVGFIGREIDILAFGAVTILP